MLGLVEGLANAVACVVQIYAGRLSDARGGRRKPLAVTGYLVSNVMRPLLGLATAWWHVVLIRSLDRVGKGIRNAPRDALIVDLSPMVMRARAFGIHRAFDNLGAVGGALLGALLISAFSSNLKDVLMISAIPGLSCVALFAFGVREKRKAVEPKPMVYALHWRDVPPYRTSRTRVRGINRACADVVGRAQLRQNFWQLRGRFICRSLRSHGVTAGRLGVAQRRNAGLCTRLVAAGPVGCGAVFWFCHVDQRRCRARRDWRPCR